MQQIINFIIRNKTFLLFVLLLFISAVLTIQTHSYHKSRFINSANFLSGNAFVFSNNISDYFKLKEQNQLLQEENNKLKSVVFNTNKTKDSVFIDSLSFTNRYQFTSARVIRNSYKTNNNILLINKGKNNGVKQDLGVISSKGIIGIVEATTTNFATVFSILNTTSSISAQLKKTNHFGSLRWDSNSPNTIQLTEIPKIATIAKGDTIITSGRSSIFPKGVPIGSISNFKLDMANNYYEIEIALFNDMTNLEHIYIIENKDTKQINSLLNNHD